MKKKLISEAKVYFFPILFYLSIYFLARRDFAKLSQLEHGSSCQSTVKVGARSSFYTRGSTWNARIARCIMKSGKVSFGHYLLFIFEKI